MMPSMAYARRPTTHAHIARVGCHAVDTTPLRSSGVTAAAPSVILGLCDGEGRVSVVTGQVERWKSEMTTDNRGH